jgi:capsular polysaccharide biosynthesis protein
MPADHAPTVEQAELNAHSNPVAESAASGVSMDLSSLVQMLVRRWRVAVPASLLTLLGVMAVAQLSPPTYQSTGSIVLLSPPEPPDAVGQPELEPPVSGQNPYARFGDLSIMADILARIVGDESTRAELAAQGVTSYEVTANRLSRGPVIEVTGQSSSADGAVRSAELVLAEVDAVLSELQQTEGVDPEYVIKDVAVQPPATATPLYGSTIRSVIAALAVGGLVTLGLVVLAEVLAPRLAARRRKRAISDPVVPEARSAGSIAGHVNGSPKSAGLVSGSSGFAVAPGSTSGSPGRDPNGAGSTSGSSDDSLASPGRASRSSNRSSNGTRTMSGPAAQVRSTRRRPSTRRPADEDRMPPPTDTDP